MAFANEPFAPVSQSAVDGARVSSEHATARADRAEAAKLQTDIEDVFGPVIYGYSRKRAIEDGVLVDLMQEETVQLVREAGFKFPIAMTAAAFRKCVHDPDAGPLSLPPMQDLKGRLWDVLWMLKCAISRIASSDTVAFELLVRNWVDYPKSRRHRLERVKLWSKCGPGDDAEPVITIMLPDEA